MNRLWWACCLFFMGYEDIPPGAAIPPHYHQRSDEILFIQRGTGVALLGARKGSVSRGTRAPR